MKISKNNEAVKRVNERKYRYTFSTNNFYIKEASGREFRMKGYPKPKAFAKYVMEKSPNWTSRPKKFKYKG